MKYIRGLKFDENPNYKEIYNLISGVAKKNEFILDNHYDWVKLREAKKKAKEQKAHEEEQAVYEANQKVEEKLEEGQNVKNDHDINKPGVQHKEENVFRESDELKQKHIIKDTEVKKEDKDLNKDVNLNNEDEVKTKELIKQKPVDESKKIHDEYNKEVKLGNEEIKLDNKDNEQRKDHIEDVKRMKQCTEESKNINIKDKSNEEVPGVIEDGDMLDDGESLGVEKKVVTEELEDPAARSMLVEKSKTFNDNEYDYYEI